jgi:hypothetical protein
VIPRVTSDEWRLRSPSSLSLSLWLSASHRQASWSLWWARAMSEFGAGCCVAPPGRDWPRRHFDMPFYAMPCQAINIRRCNIIGNTVAIVIPGSKLLTAAQLQQRRKIFGLLLLPIFCFFEQSQFLLACDYSSVLLTPPPSRSQVAGRRSQVADCRVALARG